MNDNDLLLNSSSSNSNRHAKGVVSTSKTAQVGFKAVNSKISEGLCTLLTRRAFDAGHLVTDLAPMPTHKMLQIFSSRPPGGKGTSRQAIEVWDPLVALQKELPAKCKFGHINSVIASQLNLRGPASRLDVKVPYLGKFGLKGVNWNPFCEDVVRDGVGNVACASLVMNWCHPASRIDPVLQLSERKWRKRCFVHWFEEHGVGDVAFDAALTLAREAVDSYYAVDM